MDLLRNIGWTILTECKDYTMSDFIMQVNISSINLVLTRECCKYFQNTPIYEQYIV